MTATSDVRAMAEEALTHALPILEEMAKPQSGYGYFIGGDPRSFHPDDECCTPAEIAAWKADCERAERGEARQTRTGHDVSEDGRAIVQLSGYGIGSYTYTDEDAVKARDSVKALVDSLLASSPQPAPIPESEIAACARCGSKRIDIFPRTGDPYCTDCAPCPCAGCRKDAPAQPAPVLTEEEREAVEYARAKLPEWIYSRRTVGASLLAIIDRLTSAPVAPSLGEAAPRLADDALAVRARLECDVTGIKPVSKAHALAAFDRIMATPTVDLVAHLHRQRAFSERTFGPGTRLKGVLDHIRKELIEVERAPGDVTEWIDVVLLALDGAWRAGHSPESIASALLAKQAKNEARTWPDWRTADPDKAIGHVKAVEDAAPVAPGCKCRGRGALCGCGGAYDDTETETGAGIPGTCDCADLRSCDGCAVEVAAPMAPTNKDNA